MASPTEANRLEATEQRTPDDVRWELRETRQEVAATATELKAELANRVASAKQRMNVIELARQNPLTAIAIALAAGFAIAATGADEKTVEATKSGASNALDKAKDLMHRGGADAGAQAATAESEPGRVRSFIDEQGRMLGDELRRGATEIQGTVAGGGDARGIA